MALPGIESQGYIKFYTFPVDQPNKRGDFSSARQRKGGYTLLKEIKGN
jgi:hypothetical protein